MLISDLNHLEEVKEATGIQGGAVYASTAYSPFTGISSTSGGTYGTIIASENTALRNCEYNAGSGDCRVTSTTIYY